MSPETPAGVVRLALAKGRMFDEVVQLLKEAGIRITQSERGYRPNISLPHFTAKILKPRNVIGMLHANSRDLGFAGNDWVAETGAELVPLLETNLNPVRLVVAAPHDLLEDGQLPDRELVIATEYPNLAKRWIAEQKLNARVLTTFGATEVFPPEDADLIIDNTATGSTLRANGLTILDDVLTSSTGLYASPAAAADPVKRPMIDDFVLLLQSVLSARGRVMMDLNVQQENLPAVLQCLPSMRQPTVSPLSDSEWVAVRAAVPRSELAAMIPRLKAAGAFDIVTSTPEQIIP